MWTDYVVRVGEDESENKYLIFIRFHVVISLLLRLNYAPCHYDEDDRRQIFIIISFEWQQHDVDQDNGLVVTNRFSSGIHSV